MGQPVIHFEVVGRDAEKLQGYVQGHVVGLVQEA